AERARVPGGFGGPEPFARVLGASRLDGPAPGDAGRIRASRGDHPGLYLLFGSVGGGAGWPHDPAVRHRSPDARPRPRCPGAARSHPGPLLHPFWFLRVAGEADRVGAYPPRVWGVPD